MAALLRCEALAVFSLALYLIVKWATSHPSAPMALAMEILFALLACSGLLAAARGFVRGRNYGRSPAVLANLIALGVSIFQAQAHLWLLALPLALISIVIVVLTLSIAPNHDAPNHDAPNHDAPNHDAPNHDAPN